MKKLFSPLVILSLFFASCNHHPSDESQDSTTQSVDSGDIDLGDGAEDSVILKEQIVSTAKQYFSDSLHMDSFVAEVPAGDLLKNSLYIKIYNSSNELLFLDSISPTEFFDEEGYDRGKPQAEVAINDLRRGIAGIFGTDNFTVAGDEEAIKNAGSAQINNMIGWDEAIADSTKMVFSFFDSYKGTSYVTYSEKLKKAVVIVQVSPSEDED